MNLDMREKINETTYDYDDDNNDDMMMLMGGEGRTSICQTTTS